MQHGSRPLSPKVRMHNWLLDQLNLPESTYSSIRIRIDPSLHEQAHIPTRQRSPASDTDLKTSARSTPSSSFPHISPNFPPLPGVPRLSVSPVHFDMSRSASSSSATLSSHSPPGTDLGGRCVASLGDRGRGRSLDHRPKESSAPDKP